MSQIVNICMLALDKTGISAYLTNLLLKDTLDNMNDIFENSESKLNESSSRIRSRIKAQKLLINDFNDTFSRLK